MQHTEGNALRRELSSVQYSARRIAETIARRAPEHARAGLVREARYLQMMAVGLRERVLAVTGD